MKNEWKEIAYYLREIIDDIDTATDTLKPDNSHKFTQYVYRKIEQANLVLYSKDGLAWKKK